MKNSKSIFRSIVKYLLLVIILIGGSFGTYSYFNSNTGSISIPPPKGNISPFGSSNIRSPFE